MTRTTVLSMTLASAVATSLLVGASPAQAGPAAAADPKATAAVTTGAPDLRTGPYLKNVTNLAPAKPRKAEQVSVAAPEAKAGDELVSLRTATTRTYATDTPGEFETKAFTEPVNYRDAAGAWHDIDTTLTKGGDGAWHSTAGPVKVTVAGAANAASLTNVELGGGLGIGWGLTNGTAENIAARSASPDAASGSNGSNTAAKPVAPAGVAPKVTKSTADFSGALPSTAVQVSATPTGVKEDIVLADATAPSTYRFALNLRGLTAKLAEDGSVALTDKNGQERASIPAGWMADAKGATSDKVSYSLEPNTGAAASGKQTLVVTADPTWLADPARAYPVTIDPSLTANAASDDTYVASNATTTDFSGASVLKVGQSAASGPVFRSFLHFDVSSLRGMYINYAEVRAYTTKSASCTATTVNANQASTSWTGSSTRWPGPSTSTQIGAQPATGGASGCAASWMQMRVSQAVRRWTSIDPALSQTNYGVMLAAPSESDPSLYHEFASSETSASGTAPYLQVSWRNPNLGLQDQFRMLSSDLFDGNALAVNPANGNVVVSGADVSVPGKNGTDVSLARSYNSQDDPTRSGAPGTRWTLSGGQDIRLSVSGMDNSAVFEGLDGTRLVFFWNRYPADGGAPRYDPPVGANATLTRNSTTSFDYTVTYNDTGLAYRFTGDPALKSITDPNGATITYGYDTNGRATTVTDTRGGVTKLAYTSAGLLSTITDPFNRVTTYTYGGTGGTDLVKVTDPAGLVTAYGYDSNHTLTSVTDPRGKVTTLAYDGSGRVSTITWADSTSSRPDVTRYAYPSATQTSVADPRGNATTYNFTSDGRGTVSKITDVRGLTQTFAYDSVGNVTDYTNTEGGTGKIGYAGLSHDVGSTQAPTGATSSAAYSITSRPSSTTNPRGVTTTNTWANAAQLTQSVTGGVTTSATYQASNGSCPGALATSTNGLGGVTSYAYDTRCRLVTITPPSPLGKTTQTWDSLDRLASSTDGVGRKSVYTYDADDRVTKVDYYAAGASTSSSSVSFTLDGNGNTTQQVDINAGVTRTSSYTFDALNQVTNETLPTGTGTATYSNGYAYDVAGNLTSLTTPAGTTSYVYDTVNRPTSMTPPSTPAITFSYYEDTSSEVDFPNKVTQTQSYDKDGRLQQLQQYRYDGSTYQNYASWSYSYKNPADNTDTDKIYSYADSGRSLSQSYSYDALGRVTASKGVSNGDTFDDYSYAYDKDGNRTSWSAFGRSSTATYNSADQMTARTYNGGAATTYSYDAAGGLLSTTEGDGYTYDARGRVATTKPYGAAQQTMTYTGGGNETRIAAGASGGKSLTDSALGVTSQTVASGANAGTTQFLRSPNGDVLGQVGPDGKAWYFLSNHEGSITGITNTAGQQVNSFGYGPYGEYDFGSDSSSGTGPIVNWKYIGEYSDNDNVSGATIYKFGARYYDPALGRFTQRDPAGLDVNSYVYAGGDPVNSVDPEGLQKRGIKQLSGAEQKALDDEKAGKTGIDPKILKSAKQKVKSNEKYAGDRNKQKRASHYFSAHKVGGVILATGAAALTVLALIASAPGAVVTG